MLIKLSYPATINTHVGTIAIAMEPMIFNETCFIPTWTWNSYKNCECLTSSWGGQGWGKMWLNILDRKRKYKVLDPVVVTIKTSYSQEVTDKYTGQLLWQPQIGWAVTVLSLKYLRTEASKPNANNLEHGVLIDKDGNEGGGWASQWGLLKTYHDFLEVSSEKATLLW